MKSENINLTIYPILYAHIIVTSILIYSIIIPLINKSGINDEVFDLFKNYYIDNKYKSLILDFFIIYVIIKLAEKSPKNFPKLFSRILCIIIFDTLLTIYINKTSWDQGTIHFLRIWIKKLSLFALIWDIIYMSLTAKLADKINNIHFLKNQYVKLMINIIIIVFLLHV